VSVGPITSIALLPDAAKGVTKALKALGLTFPKPLHFVEKSGARIVWTGRDQAFLIGVAPPELGGAAVTDQSDGWTVLAVTGAAAVDVLARLVPMDLRLATFPVGRVLRTQVNHMNAVILRTGDYAIEIMVFRSMARTAWHEIQTAMEMVAARSSIKI